MATINLGSIKFKWQGAYNGATAYTVDDVVSYNGSSYICIANSTGNLPTNTSYFEQMSSAGTNGTNGTDLSTTLTTQGDLVYRDGSGLQRLGAGTAGQVLQTGGAGANPSWVDAGGGKVLQVVQTVKTDTYTSTATSMTDITGMSVSITPSATSSKILILVDAKVSNGNGNNQFVHLRRNTSDEIYRGDASSSRTRASSAFYVHSAIAATGYYGVLPLSLTYLDSPNTTSATTYKLSHSSSEALQFALNRANDDGDDVSRPRTASSITVMEIGA